MKDNRRRRPSQPRVSPSVLERLNPHVAGIDCGSAEHFVAVPPDRDQTPVRSFPTFTGDLHRLADWLTACRVTSVAMEATGVYWIPIYEILEARGFDVHLVNARHVKNVPGRKSDVSDCEWLRELHSVGLLRGSFRPTDTIVALRAYLRHRQTLIEGAGAHIQRMQKALIQMNLQLPLVVSDITGVTGLRILRDIVTGRRDPTQLADHRDHRCHASKTEITAALTGNYRPEHVFVLQQNLELFDVCQAKLAACDTAIEAHVQMVTASSAPPATPLPAARVTKKPRDNGTALRDPNPVAPADRWCRPHANRRHHAVHRAEIAVGDRHRHGPVAVRETLHLLAHAGPEEHDIGRPTPQLPDATVRQSCRRDSPDDRDESRANTNRPRRVLSALGRPNRQAAGHYCDGAQARHPGLSSLKGRTGLS